MPAKTTNTTTKTNYNPTVTAFFENQKFGDGALLSATLDAKAFEAVQRHIQIGAKLLIRKSKKENKNGGSTYFLEVLPPQADTNFSSKKSSNSDDI